jgi:hypothetical protein
LMAGISKGASTTTSFMVTLDLFVLNDKKISERNNTRTRIDFFITALFISN